jgi:hypothetical protein
MSKTILLCLFLSSLAFGQSEGDLRSLEGRSNDGWTGPSETASDEQQNYNAAKTSKSEHSGKLKLNPAIAPIEAEEFNVKLLMTSSSGKVLLLLDPSNNEPRPGKILLLKDGNTDIAAVRVLKNRDGRFIAKIVFQDSKLERDKEYRALKKLGNKNYEKLAPVEQKRLDNTIRDKELAEEIDPDDAELDRGIPKPTAKSKSTAKKEPDLSRLEISEDELADYPVDFEGTEETDLAPYKNSLSMQLALLNNATSNGGTTRYTSIGLRYGYAPIQKLFFKRPNLQDTLALEAGAFIYRIAGYETPVDELSVLAVPINLRYNLYLNEWFALFTYLGAVKSFVTISAGTVPSGTAPLARTRPMIGGGFLLKLGPGWSLRGDFGFDQLSFGAVLSF